MEPVHHLHLCREQTLRQANNNSKSSNQHHKTSLWRVVIARCSHNYRLKRQAQITLTRITKNKQLLVFLNLSCWVAQLPLSHLLQEKMTHNLNQVLKTKAAQMDPQLMFLNSKFSKGKAMESNSRIYIGIRKLIWTSRLLIRTSHLTSIPQLIHQREWLRKWSKNYNLMKVRLMSSQSKFRLRSIKIQNLPFSNKHKFMVVIPQVKDQIDHPLV